MVQAAPHHLLRLPQADGVTVLAARLHRHHLHLRLLREDGEAMVQAAHQNL
jgi:hypothetical protein